LADIVGWEWPGGGGLRGGGFVHLADQVEFFGVRAEAGDLVVWAQPFNFAARFCDGGCAGMTMVFRGRGAYFVLDLDII
jgi:hypothetical protein